MEGSDVSSAYLWYQGVFSKFVRGRRQVDGLLLEIISQPTVW